MNLPFKTLRVKKGEIIIFHTQSDVAVQKLTPAVARIFGKRGITWMVLGPNYRVTKVKKTALA